MEFPKTDINEKLHVIIMFMKNLLYTNNHFCNNYRKLVKTKTVVSDKIMNSVA